MNCNYLISGPPGCGKTYNAKKRVLSIIHDKEYSNIKQAFPMFSITKDDLEKDANVNTMFKKIKNDLHEVVKFIALQPNYSYSDFVEGIVLRSKEGELFPEYSDKVFLQLVDNMERLNSPGFLILDDADRVEIADIFGDLVSAIAHRNTEIRLLSGKTVSVPENLYIVITTGSLNNNHKMDYSFRSLFHEEKMTSNYDRLRPALFEYVRRFASSQEENTAIVDGIAGTDKYDKDALYGFYNRICRNVSNEFADEQPEYEIGFSYFLPNSNELQQIEVVCQHKIHHQVIPLLKQYAKEGIISNKDVPIIERTNTVFTREKSLVHEPEIVCELDSDTWEYGQDIFAKGIKIGQNVAYSKTPGRGNLKVNRPYLMLFEIVHDMIEHNIINVYQLMDIFTDDKNIFCTRRDLGFGGGGLFAENSLANIIIMKNGGEAKNSYSLYNPNFHYLKYGNRRYRMISKLAGSESVPQKLTKCYPTGEGGQNSNSLQGLKVLVHTFLHQFKENLLGYINEATDVEKSEALSDLKQLEQDIKCVELMTTETKYSSEDYYLGKTDYIYSEIVKYIRELPTWKKMLNNQLKGVYRNMDRRYKNIMDVTGIHQMILQGPPGTSKTFGAKLFLSQEIGLASESDTSWNEQDLESHKLSFANGVYILPDNPSKIDHKVFWDVIQFHPSYCYEDFIRGITVSTDNGKKIQGKISNAATSYDMELDAGNGIAYKTINKTFGALCEIANKNPDGTFFLLVDEINRANLATVFGELIYALEYRDEDVATPYTVDGTKSNAIKVPGNVYIIGTMNTADKSIGNIDYAIRRRFLFFPALPSVKPVKDSIGNGEKWEESDEVKLFFATEHIFETILNTDDYDKDDVQIGHTYFIRKKDSEIKYRFMFQVIPVIKEYIKDGVILVQNNDNDPIIDVIFDMTKNRTIEELEKNYDLLIKTISDSDIFKKYING